MAQVIGSTHPKIVGVQRFELPTEIVNIIEQY